jgi:predicted amidohydrolase
MIIAAGQTIPKDSINENLEEHYKLIELAADNNAQLIIFPELSLTGYQREEAEKYSFKLNDPRLDKLKEFAKNRKIVIIVGAPLKINNKIHICSFIISPKTSVEIYTKQFLHSGEELFFDPNLNYNPQIKIKEEIFSLAICSDIANPVHPNNASKVNCTTYLASIFYTPNGINDGYEMLSEYAKRYSMNVLMANYGGKSYQFESAGKSAFWTNTGELKSNFIGTGCGLLIAKKENNHWISTIIESK